MTQDAAALVWSTFADRESAQSVAKQFLDEKLIACANMLPETHALFEWDGAIDNAIEVAVLFKTSGDLLDTLTTRLGELHPYEIPAIIGWKCDSAHPKTTAWLDQVTAITGRG